uniref:Ionotropic glutamate receptor L-glutamate and glycine-binding domain-containing protein n=1 Tax=Anopheles albimanus TaxID=7167 RepID=A0A182F4J2_ANOAL
MATSMPRHHTCGHRKHGAGDNASTDVLDFNLFQDDNPQLELAQLMLDLIEQMPPGHCYAFLYDEVYESVFEGELFERIKQVSRFIVKIPTDEDTLNPRPSLLCNLQEIRKVGCGGYVMLLANGIQMERLLRFGDQTRTIDTRARFIMLHDYRLFQPQMHYLWKRIVNVVFLRPLRNRRALYRKAESQQDGTVYELSTVPFPIPLKGIFFSKILNFWQRGKFRSLSKSKKALFGDKTTDLQGQLMQVVVLEHTPAVFKSNAPAHTVENGSPSRATWSALPQQQLYYGVEIELLKAIANAMHFRMAFYETPDAETERWGEQKDNGTLTGLLGEMREGRADFALADLHHTEYHLAFMDLTTPYNTECLTFLTPEALSDNSWKTLILPFNGEMWAGWSLRVLTGWYWVYCVLVVVAYRASFTAILANPVPRLTIDTLHDLAESPLLCLVSSLQNQLFFQMAGDPNSQAVSEKLEIARNANEAVERVVEAKYAYYENIYLLRQLRSTRKSEKARQTLHIMQECVVLMPISIGLEKNSPLKSQVDRYVRALIEGGLTGKWLSDAIERFQSNVELPPQEATIDLKKMYAGIVALAIGYSVSMVAFAVEKLYWRFVVETNPAFDNAA